MAGKNPLKIIMQWLKLPETRDIADLDDPATTELHRRIIEQKTFLRNTYIDFYRQFAKSVADPDNKVLVELGSGGGFIKKCIPNVITSDVLELAGVDKVFSAMQMPFDDGSVDAFFMIDVLHHISDTRAFFREAQRCLKVDGKIVMIEPANTIWARFIYTRWHHEGFDPGGRWGLEDTGPLSSANGAIPWIVFCRDRGIFQKEFPQLDIRQIRPHTPLRYLISGGLTLRQLLPGFAYPVVRAMEIILWPMNSIVGMFLTIELQKTRSPLGI